MRLEGLNEKRIKTLLKLPCSDHIEQLRKLLIMEQYKMEQDLAFYSMPAAKMKRDGQYLVLPVPGLAEKRPSVLIGDAVMVCPLLLHNEYYRANVLLFA
jgi:hypothetical protein